MDDPPWKKLNLSLERPYKDDKGELIPTLLDITPEGEHIYEPTRDPSKELGERLQRIFLERGMDFFEGGTIQRLKEGSMTEPLPGQTEHDGMTSQTETGDKPAHTMTSDELLKMRMKVLPQLHVALGEMSHAKDLLTLLLSSAPSNSAQTSLTEPSIQTSSSSTLTATVVAKPEPIASVQAFNAQLVISGKDEALRKASDLFRAAADNIERSLVKSERYWVDALKIRRGNWGLVPAPLPLGSSTGKGAEKASKDFLISFGLEESPAVFRRQALGRMSNQENLTEALEFPRRQRNRLRVSIKSFDAVSGHTSVSQNRTRLLEDGTIEGSLRSAQQEVVEQEIFSALVREAPNLHSATVRVSERLIVIDAVQDMQLIFELVESDIAETPVVSSLEGPSSWKCDLIHSALHVLLLRLHGHLKQQRLGPAGVMRTQPPAPPLPPPILQPIIDYLQYEVFCRRVKVELDRAVEALAKAGLRSALRFEPVGESGQQIVQLLEEHTRRKLTGEAVLRIDDRYTLRLTFVSPSTLTVHLSQADLAVPSIPQLSQLLSNEIERCLLRRICDIGSKLCEKVNGVWFVDDIKGQSIGRWEGCVLNLRVICESFSMRCVVVHLKQTSGGVNTLHHTYDPQNVTSLLVWVEDVITTVLAS